MTRIKSDAAANRHITTVPAYQSGWVSFLRRVSIWLLAVALVYAFEFLWSLSTRANQIDFSHYYVSALAMRQGIDPYTTDLRPLATALGLDIAEMDRATYPPTFVLCFEPLTLLSPLTAYWLWTAMNIVFLATAVYLLFDGLPRDTDLRLALAGLAILYAPVTDNFYYAQTQILLLLLLILFMRWLGSGRYALAGSTLALAVLLKVFPVILAGYLVLRREGKVIVYMGLGLALGGVVTLALAGVETSSHFLQVLPFLSSPYFLGRAANVALGAIISHLFWAGSGVPRLEFARRVAVAMADLTLLALTARATFRSSKLSDRGDEHVIALWIVTAVLLSPTAWVHYVVLLLILFAVLVRERLRRTASLRAVRLGMASYLIAELLLAVDLGFGQLPNWALPAAMDWAVFAAMIGWPLSLLLAYAAAYFLAIDTMAAPVAARD